MEYHVESGVQLFTRLRQRPSIQWLDETLFPEGLENRNFIEISGNVSTGKSLLINQLIAKCILPIGGLGASAVLINTDCHFQVSKLLECMMRIAKHSYQTSPANGQEPLDVTVQKAMDNLIVINCYDYNNLLLALYTLEDIFFANEKIILLAIDSLSSFYWQNRQINNVWSMDLYIKNLIKIIQLSTLPFSVVTMYTSTSDSTKSSFDCHTTKKNIQYIVHLHNDINKEKGICLVRTIKEEKKIAYTVHSDGIIWAKNNS